MAAKIIWSPRAIADLGEIARYIARSSPLTAERFCPRLIGHVEALPDFPLKGRVVPEHGRENPRELVFPPYRIAYQITPGGVIEIMTVWHAARGALDV